MWGQCLQLVCLGIIILHYYTNSNCTTYKLLTLHPLVHYTVHTVGLHIFLEERDQVGLLHGSVFFFLDYCGDTCKLCSTKF